jgi:hypothetical protein
MDPDFQDMLSDLFEDDTPPTMQVQEDSTATGTMDPDFQDILNGVFEDDTPPTMQVQEDSTATGTMDPDFQDMLSDLFEVDALPAMKVQEDSTCSMDPDLQNMLDALLEDGTRAAVKVQEDSTVTGTMDPDFKDMLDGLFEDDTPPAMNIGPWLREDFTIVPVSSPAHLLQAWQGDGQDIPPGLPVHEGLVVVRCLLKYGPIQAPQILSEIKRLIPTSPWTLREVSNRLRRLKNLFMFPGRWHRSMAEAFNKRITRIDDLNIIERLETTAHDTDDAGKRIHEWATDWLSACVVPSGSSEPWCIPMQFHRSDGLCSPGMTITVPRFVALLRSSEAKESEKLWRVHHSLYKGVETSTMSSMHPMRPVSSAAQPIAKFRKGDTVVPVSRPIRGVQNSTISSEQRICVLKTIVKRRVATDEIKLAEINNCLGTEVMSMQMFDHIRAGYLNLTQNTARFHNVLTELKRSTLALPTIMERMISACPELDSIEKRVQVWLEGCIGPLAAYDGTSGRHRPCWFDAHARLYRLSQTQVRDFLYRELLGIVVLKN